MAISVTIGACQGHGNCFGHCPEVFVPDIEGFSTVALDPVPAEYEAGVRAAEHACPEHAITVTESSDAVTAGNGS